MNSSLTTRRAGRQRGVTLVESMVVLAITAITLGAAAPSFERAREMRHLEGSAAQLETDVNFVRGLAVASNRGVRIGFQASAAGSCYVVHTGPAHACECRADNTAVCSPDGAAIKTVFFADGGPVSVRANTRSMLFDPERGTSTPTGTLRVVGRQHGAIHHIVNIMGRVRSCSPDGSVGGYPRC